MLKPIPLKCCGECREPLSGRSDKKFCDDNCRTAYNNRLKSDQTCFMRNINNLLRRNRRILSYFHSRGNVRIARQQLLESGFLFNYFTSSHSMKKEQYIFVYEYGYMPISENELLLVKSDDPPVSFH